MRRRVAVASAIAALVLPAAAAAFDNLEPLASHQWYLVNDQAWTYWPTEPQLYPVNVAVIDSGIDGTHPEFTGRIRARADFCEVFRIYWIQLFLAQQRDVNRIHIRIQHGGGEAGVDAAARRIILRQLVNFHP